MCGGGGDAQRAAEQAERERKQQVRSSTAAIDQAFSGRSGQLEEFLNALRENFRTDATRQKKVADRQLKFSLARGGLTGGSAAADAGTNLGREFQEGLLKGERQSQVSLADLLAADQASKQQLIALAQGGADVSTAARSSATALQANLKNARSSGLAFDIGNIFEQTGDLFVRQQEAAERRRGLKESDIFADPFSRG